jgi:hypothetical protein
MSDQALFLPLLNGVTVDGGLKVDTNAHLQLQSSTINGGIVVDPGGELDVNAMTLNGRPTFNSSIVNGGITIRGRCYHRELHCVRLQHEDFAR